MSLIAVQQRINGYVVKDPKRVIDMWSRRKNQQIHEVALRTLNAWSPASFLDCGCGTGDIIVAMEALGWPMDEIKVTGYDVSDEAILVAKARYPQHNWLFQQHPPDNGSWDFGLCFGPLCYTWDMTDKWKAITSVLGDLMRCTKHGVAYFMYTDKWKAKPGSVFTRFHPDEIKGRFPEVTVHIPPDLIQEYVDGLQFCDMDKGLITW